jgi:diadenosine tetraphosphate (Ap4A) HIT family hydrolase
MIHPQLAQDSHYLGALASGSVLLHRNASLPWFILVPATELEDVLDLPADTLARIMADCQQLSCFIKQQLGFAKVNFAGLGNVVPQMHLHVIGRAVGDACWPQPVWGNLCQESDYDSDTLAKWRQQLGLRVE